jgi:hypothetical protein
VIDSHSMWIFSPKTGFIVLISVLSYHSPAQSETCDAAALNGKAWSGYKQSEVKENGTIYFEVLFTANKTYSYTVTVAEPLITVEGTYSLNKKPTDCLITFTPRKTTKKPTADEAHRLAGEHVMQAEEETYQIQMGPQSPDCKPDGQNACETLDFFVPSPNAKHLVSFKVNR